MFTQKVAKLAGLFVLLSIAPVALVPQSASAHPNGLPPDSSTHTYCLANSMNDNPNVRNAADYGMNNLQAQTQFTRAKNSSCDPTTDVQFRVWDGNGSGDPRGEWVCVDIQVGKCYKATVTFWPDVIAADGGPYIHNLQKTACHEIGHSVDQTHHNAPYGDCMVSGPVSSGHLTYNSTHVGFINGLY